MVMQLGLGDVDYVKATYFDILDTENAWSVVKSVISCAASVKWFIDNSLTRVRLNDLKLWDNQGDDPSKKTHQKRKYRFASEEHDIHQNACSSKKLLESSSSESDSDSDSSDSAGGEDITSNNDLVEPEPEPNSV
ncbi:hypothetical protein FQR65_LT05499 [Abscondita terminalis]|nr:hypothetical protein FQR65_LT05499 [Abscondita terminalis]